MGDPGFLKALDELRELHLSKGHDYADEGDPLRNYVVSSEAGGVEPWRGAFIRLAEKFHRLSNLLKKGDAPNHESLDDTFMDLAAMALIVRSLRARVNRVEADDCPACGTYHQAICQGDGDHGESHIGGEPV